MKLFVIDYYFKENRDEVKTYMTKAPSRGQAEKKCREMVSPDTIGIKTIKSYEIGGLVDDDSYDKHSDNSSLG